MVIGGHTITELQAKLGTEEFRIWLAYRKKYGPMNPVRAYDRGPALITSMLLNVHGGKATPDQFLAYGHDPVDENAPEPTVSEFIRSIGGANVVKRG